MAGNSQRFTVLFKGHVIQARFRPRRNEYFMSRVGFYSYWLPKGWFWVNGEGLDLILFWQGIIGQPWLRKSELPKLLRLFALNFKDTHRCCRTKSQKQRAYLCKKGGKKRAVLPHCSKSSRTLTQRIPVKRTRDIYNL